MNKIKLIRESKGLRQIDVAKLCGVGIATIWNLEHGLDERASEKTRKKIAAGLGLKVEELFPNQC